MEELAHFTDWRTLWRDMVQYAREHRSANFLCSDNPRSEPRLYGWSAWYLDAEGEEQSKEWTISTQDMMRCLRLETPEIERLFRTAEGRLNMLPVMLSEARMPVLEVPKTIWERLADDT